MRLSRAASRYAKAVLSLAVEKNQADAVNVDMKSILTTLNGSKELRDFLSSPLVKSEQKRGALREVFKNTNEMTSGVFDLLVDNKRADILMDVATKYVILFEEMNKREIATVITAVELTPQLEEKILAKAKALAGKDITLEKKIDESIIGGFILTVGDQQVNASVAGKLDSLKRTFA
jgi:F-type H+-transporting ATPase subunit delta